MMLRLVQISGSMPFSWPVDPAANFYPGMIAQLKTMGNNVVCGVCDGSAPIGIIDDIKTNSFNSVSINETVIGGPVEGVPGPRGVLITPIDIKVELANAAIVANSFVSDPVDVYLNPRNGVVTFLAGTELNMDMDGDGIPDSIRTFVNYTYQVPNIPGEDSTVGSSRVTVWFQRIIAQTDQFDTTQRYPLNANLFCNEEGKFTSRQPSPDHPGIAIVTGSPSSTLSNLEFLLL